MIMMLMIEVSLKKYRILPRKNLFLWARLQYSSGTAIPKPGFLILANIFFIDEISK